MSIRVIEVMAWRPEIPGWNLPGRGEASWQDQALCAETDPEAFFPGDGESASPAKRVCLACEVRVTCLEWAVANGIAYGVYGGLDERERRALGPQHLDFRPGPGPGKELAA